MFWAAVCVIIALLPGLASAQDISDETVISTEICSRLWIVPLLWSPDGVEPQELVGVFDTGATSTFIDPDALERISGRRISQGKRVSLDDMSVAGRSFHTFRPKVLDLDHLSRALGRQLDVFLPFQAFDNFLLVLDYPAEEMRIRREELPEPDGVMVFDARGRDDRPWLKVQIGRIERRLLIDSGSSGSMAVHPSGKLDWVAEPIPLRLFQGMYDIELTSVGRLEGEAQVGSLEFFEPLVALTEDTELLGAQVLRHFILSFDQINRRVRLDPATAGPVTTRPYRGTGMILRQREDGYEVFHVIEDSPAAAAGLRPGDKVTHIDRIAVHERGCRAFDNEPGETTMLTVVRNGDSREIIVPNAILIH